MNMWIVNCSNAMIYEVLGSKSLAIHLYTVSTALHCVCFSLSLKGEQSIALGTSSLLTFKFNLLIDNFKASSELRTNGHY